MSFVGGFIIKTVALRQDNVPDVVVAAAPGLNSRENSRGHPCVAFWEVTSQCHAHHYTILYNNGAQNGHSTDTEYHTAAAAAADGR